MFGRAGTKGVNPHKVLWSAVGATYVLGIIDIAFHKCGTGTSIIGVSLSAILLFYMSNDMLRNRKQGKATPALIIVIFSFIFVFFVLYFYNPIIHLSGLLIFIVLLSGWDDNFRKNFMDFIVSLWITLKNPKHRVRKLMLRFQRKQDD